MKQIAPNSMIQNRYLIVQMIGKGGMGEVYLAVDQRLGSAVALKRTFFHENAELGNAFEREAKILGRLRHPVLPKVIDHFIEGGEQYLVMEHISGDDLGKRLEGAGKPFPLSWVMFWADQMLDALNYLHSHEPPIVHRDIKPENLKLTDDNHIVLLDFGLSKDFDSEAKKASLGTGSIVGYSPYYASMEQVRGTGTDARSDIYSLSATLYQLLTNEYPVDSLTRADAMLGGSADPIAAISDSNPEVSPAVSEVILKGIAVRKEDRYETAAEMQKALRRAFNQGATAEKDDAAILASEAPTAMRSIPPDLSGVTSKPTDDVSGALDDTIQFKTGETDPGPKQADIATQIFNDGSLSDAAVEEDFDGEVTRQQMPKAETPVSEAPAMEAPVTETPEVETPEVETREEEAMPAAAAAAAVGVAEPAQFAAQPQMAAVQPKKKSKAGLMVGGLVGLLLLAGVVGGGGWYAYNNYYLPSKVSASPTPTPDITVSPSPQPTSEVVTDGNRNSNSTVGQVDNTNASDNSNRMVVTTPTDPRQPTTVGKNPPGQTTKPPSAKSTPKTKGKDDRTVILQ